MRFSEDTPKTEEKDETGRGRKNYFCAARTKTENRLELWVRLTTMLVPK